MAPQVYKKPPQAPPLFTGTAESVLKDMKDIIHNSRKQLDRWANEINEEDATFENIMRDGSLQDNEDSLTMEILLFYQAVSEDQSLRDASTEAQKIHNDFQVEATMREDIFRLIRAVYEKKEQLDPEDTKLIEESYKGYIRQGMGLPAGAKRDRFKEIQLKLGNLTTDFDRNLAEEKGGVWFTPEELKGVPQDVVGSWDKGTGENEGKLKMDFAYPSYFPTVKYAQNAETRHRAYVGNSNKMPNNEGIFLQVVSLRDEAARLLGYPNHATLKIENKMAKKPKIVNDFLGDLRGKLTEGGASEKEALMKMKKSDVESKGKAFDDHYFLWDHPYYNRIMLEKDYSVDHEQLSEYFPLSTCLPKMLQIFEKLLGLAFVEVVGKERDELSPDGNGDHILWHKDCHLFSVWDSEDQGSGFVGYLYLDLHPRPDKYKHAANFNLQPGFIGRDGQRRYPATALVCNFTPSTKTKPSLLKHDEVVTLFHELGHGIHDLVGRTKWSRFHGTNVVRDFVEAPSQMLENWCWTPGQLKYLSHHYSYISPEYKQAWKESAGKDAEQPEETLPDDLVDKLVKSKHVNDALFNLRQLHFGIFDMTIYQPESHIQVEQWKYAELYNKLGWEIQHIDSPAQLGEGWDWGHGHTTFAHIISGYDAGYYGYLYSQVYSADMFHSVFAKDPMNPEEGRRYRRTVLEKGGSRDAVDLLRDFLGREPSTEAFYKELGWMDGIIELECEIHICRGYVDSSLVTERLDET
ncbi:uncharacterized protein KY384_003344 [Bacidia gigantensis]|uniref:uncharacterized protein n=1 Tax=Bacidia gigantensis TaxID=2732470 RepID=UPI001D03FEA7|nr:uncharacterized protein KY384_003344 [Bacidia gigantensis]KAG8531712.1 hypothetical protein KY384_003344 [Bacidia gigantensis]